MSPESQAPGWEWYYIAMYFFVGGTAAGAYFIGSLLEFVGAEKHREISKVAYYVAFPLALLCPIFLIGDLGQPTRFFNLFTTVNWLSPVSFGSWALLIFGGMSFLSFVDNLIADGKLKFAPFSNLYNRIPRKLYAIVGSVAGFFIAGYTGVLLNLTARPFWAATDPLLGTLFIASGASSGAAAIALVMAIRKMASGEAFEQLENFDRLVMFLELLLIVGIVLVAGQFAAPLVSGAYALMFWGGAVLLGVLVPLGLNWYGSRSGMSASTLVLITAILVLLGGALLRISIVQAGNT
ncbi:MAG: polysulfide reductase NrfD [Chloroflexi bacterium]|nr:polysulfide reductase NrfD [Chloroflexota bacterium]